MRNPIFVTLSDGSIRNTYDLRLRNSIARTAISPSRLLPRRVLALTLEGTDEFRVLVKANGAPAEAALYLTAKAGTVAASIDPLPVRLWITDADGPSLPPATSIEFRTFTGHDLPRKGRLR